MRTTLQEQLEQQHCERTSKFNQDHLQWLLEHEHFVTHAVTLTFAPAKIHAFLNAFDRSMKLNSPEMIERYQESLRRFVRYLDTSLFGNQSKRGKSPLFFVAVLEGQNDGEVAHFHCSIGIPDSRAEVFEKAVKESWSKVSFSGHQIKVENYRDATWLNYSNKHTKYIDRVSIDWQSVRVPSQIVTTKS
jgi:hypothetical protein